MSGSHKKRDATHPRAEAMYRYIIRYKRQHAGDSPSRREICAAMGGLSLSIVSFHLTALERDGRIKLGRNGTARTIAIPGATWHFDEVAAATTPEQTSGQ